MNDQNLNLSKIGKHKVLEEFTPERETLFRIWVIEFLLIYIGNTIIAGLLILIVSIEEGVGNYAQLLNLVYPWFFGFTLPLFVLGMIFAWIYVRAINYTLTTHEIIVEKGVITKSRKIVPYRNITNFNQRRGPFDRLLGGSLFGTIGIETAGMSGSSNQKSRPEQKLVGIKNTHEYTEKIRSILSRMKGQAAVTADNEIASSLSEEDILSEMLSTLKVIAKKI
jgi:membrane protein YdbS with pleckstrin-like domain